MQYRREKKGVNRLILRTSGQLVAGSTATTLALSSNPSLRSSSPARNTRPEPQDRPASTRVLPGFPTVRGWWGGRSTWPAGWTSTGLWSALRAVIPSSLPPPTSQTSSCWGWAGDPGRSSLPQKLSSGSWRAQQWWAWGRRSSGWDRTTLWGFQASQNSPTSRPQSQWPCLWWWIPPTNNVHTTTNRFTNQIKKLWIVYLTRTRLE